MASSFHAVVAKLLPDTERFLCDLIRFPSTPGQEHEEMLFLEREFQKLGVAVERVPLHDAIKNDPDYSDPVPDIKYEGRFNLRVTRRGTGGGRRLLVNAHTDVVPPSEGMTQAWTPRVENGIVYGRGACDDKGQVALTYLLFRALEAAKVKLAGDVVAHLVVEEENGGNGSLAMTRAGEKADGCVVLEATEGKLLTSIRGAVWFRVTFQGRAGHSGQPGQSRSALLMARDGIAALEKYHAGLLAASKGIPLFDDYANPMPITFGKLSAGNWPATAPSKAVLEGVLGLLPNKTKEQVMDEFRAALRGAGDEYFRNNVAVHFMYRHDAHVVDPKHPLPQGLLAAAKQAGLGMTVAAMPASCDGWLYNNQLRIPTVVYGAGALKYAHSNDEQIATRELAEAGEVLAVFAEEFCGGRSQTAP